MCVYVCACIRGGERKCLCVCVCVYAYISISVCILLFEAVKWKFEGNLLKNKLQKLHLNNEIIWYRKNIFSPEERERIVFLINTEGNEHLKKKFHWINEIKIITNDKNKKIITKI